MKTTIIFVAAGLAIGTLGGTAFTGMKEKAVILAELEAEKAAQAAALQAEESHGEEGQDQEGGAQEGHGESTEGAGTAGQSSREDAEGPAGGSQDESGGPDLQHEEDPDAAEDGMPGAPDETVAAPQTEAGEVGSDPVLPVTSPSADTVPEVGRGTERLAKIFGSMKAADAAKVLQNLDDDEVSAILLHLSNRKAGEILGNFEPGRAATLSRAVLEAHGGEEL